MKLLSFYLKDKLYGIDIHYVKELNRNIEITPVPMAQNTTAGLYNMRGSIVTLLNLYEYLGLSTHNKAFTNCIVLKPYKQSKDVFGFVLDKASDVITIKNSQVLSPPANIKGEIKEFILGAAKLDNEHITILAVDKILDKV